MQFITLQTALLAVIMSAQAPSAPDTVAESAPTPTEQTVQAAALPGPDQVEPSEFALASTIGDRGSAQLQRKARATARDLSPTGQAKPAPRSPIGPSLRRLLVTSSR
jgi:hypothetical protein